MMGSSLSTTGVGGVGVGSMLGVGGGSSATLPSRIVQRDWMASILLRGASWMPAMVVVSLVVVSVGRRGTFKLRLVTLTGLVP
jgi:hypothetical protein